MTFDESVTTLAKIDETHRKALKRLGVETVRDLLYHFPARYQDPGEAKRIANIEPGEDVLLYGTVEKLGTKKAFRSKTPMAEATLRDDSGTISLIWFHQPYIAKMISDGANVEVQGKVSERSGKFSLVNPAIEPIAELPSLSGELDLGNSVSDSRELIPIYPVTRGATSHYIAHLAGRALKKLPQGLPDPLPIELLKKLGLPTLRTALIWIHAPKSFKNAEAARKRMAFEEMFTIQIDRQQERAKLDKEKAFVIEKSREDLESAIESFGFTPTGAQEKAIQAVLDDFQKGVPASRLVEGDVGSGKTVVAAAAIYAAATTYPRGQEFGALQSAYMVPTEILAEQQFETFCDLFRHTHLQVGLITGSGCKKFPSKVEPGSATSISRAQLLRWVKSGEIAVLVGTHSLIYKSVEFKHLALVVIDEQHRFGTSQRKKLARKDEHLPHLISMTATPIPRTLALTIYGDLDLTVVDQMPKGRKPVHTQIVPPNKREATYEKIRGELKAGRQAYILCPRIDEPDPNKEKAVQAKSVKTEATRLRKDVFKEYEVGEIHGKMSPKEKDEIMREFAAGEIDILVTTSVIEVGVNVPNATVIVIEGAERFGLAQLHQLRGRVVRSNHQAYCFVFTDSSSKKTLERLKALKDAANGFELAEHDLNLRGAGDLYGRKQSGLSDIGMEAIKNIKMVEAAREEAREIVEKDPELQNHPLLKERVEKTTETLHEE